MVVEHGPLDGLPTVIRPLGPIQDLDGMCLLLDPSDPAKGPDEDAAPPAPVLAESTLAVVSPSPGPGPPGAWFPECRTRGPYGGSRGGRLAPLPSTSRPL